jgi:aminoglycoside 6'-N-acetyltransferase
VGKVTFRRLTRDDFGLLATWLAEPHVLRWWNHEFSPDAIEREFGPTADGDEPAEDHAVLLDDRPVGLIQYSRFADYPEYVTELTPVLAVPEGAASIDYLIGDHSCLGRGIGTAMISAFVDRIWSVDRNATCVIVPVNSANVASWKALLSAGFRIVARGDLAPDNPIDDPGHEILRIDRPA